MFFKNKLLRALLAPFFMYIDDPDGGGGSVADAGGGDEGGGEGSIDIASAADKIGADLFGGGKETSVDDPNPEPTPAPSAAPTPAPTPAPSAVAQKFAPPTTWRPEATAEWDKLPDQVKQEVLKREEDMFKGIEGYKNDATIGKAFQQIAAPYQKFFTDTQTDPAELTKNFFGAHAALTLGTPEQKQATLQQIAQIYGVTMPAASGDEPPYTDPQVKGLQDQIAALQSQLSGLNQRQTAVQRAEEARLREQLSSEIDAFAADPANTYFEEVANDIARLLNSGVAKDLKDAYEQAVRLNPVTYAKEIERQTAERLQKTQEEAKKKAEAAAKATAANVRTSAKQGGGTATLGSIDDTLKETFAKIKSRS